MLSLSVICVLIGYGPVFNPVRSQAKVMTYSSENRELPENTKDGVMLHAFDWSFNNIKKELPSIAAAGYKAVQVSPVQGTKSNSTNSSDWWLLYQPTNQAIGNAQLGSYDDFKSLCSEAKNYGISIVVDVVMNHMANNGNDDEVASEVDPSFKDPSLYHHNGQCTDWNNRQDVTQEGIGMPDLNTQSSAVQSKAITFLNQCVDAGATGFRFDAAKHIETDLGLDANKSWSGNYWENVLGSLHNKSNLYIYGEVLQDGKVDNISAYESFMNVEASAYDGSLRGAIKSGDLTNAQGMGGLDSNKCVDMLETHDEYEHNESKDLTDWQRKAGWAIAASRAGSVPLFFDRPTGNIGSEGDALWKDSDVVAVNEFHNAMAGQNEYLRLQNNNKAMIIERGSKGAVIVNEGDSFNLNTPTNLEDGNYDNHGSATDSLTVSQGRMTGTVPANSIIVIYNKNSNPGSDRVTLSEQAAKAGDSVTITYDAGTTALKDASNVNLYWGYDGFSAATSKAMTSLGDNKWQTTITVPKEVTKNVNFSFTDGTSWDNNNGANWNIPLASNYLPHAGYKVDYDSSNLVSGNNFTIYYNGNLANSSNVSLHWGVNGWSNMQNLAMVKDSNGFWEATIAIPASSNTLNFCFTNGSSWDNNNNNNWTLNTWSSVPKVQVTPAPEACKQISVYYNGSLASSASNITLHWGCNGFTSPQDINMVKQADGRWLANITLPSGCYNVNMAFKDQSGTWDNNNSNNYNFSSTNN